VILNLPPSVRIYLATEPVDMRKAFDGLAAATEHTLAQDPFSGHLFVFWNRRADRVKVLWYDGNGFALYYKRLERGRFHLFAGDAPARACVEVRASDLALILQGIDLRGAKRRRAWSPQRAA
jgi:transposase